MQRVVWKWDMGICQENRDLGFLYILFYIFCGRGGICEHNAALHERSALEVTQVGALKARSAAEVSFEP